MTSQPFTSFARAILPRASVSRSWRLAVTGAEALAPYSDIDLLFVRPYKETAHIESVIEFMLYALWDLGFKVGHASRTVNDCIKLVARRHHHPHLAFWRPVG